MEKLAVATLGGAGTQPAGWWRRVATAVVFIPAFVWAVTRAPAWVFPALVVAASALACGELARMFERAGQRTDAWLGAVAGGLVTAGFIVPGGPVAGLAAATALILCAPLWRRESPTAAPTLVALLGVTWVGWLLGHAVLLDRHPGGDGLVLFVVAVTWTGESAAYLLGSTIGRRKLASVISPRKTVEGAVTQLVVSVAAGALFGAWLIADWSLAAALGAGAVLGIVGQLGDLAESAIKRSVNAKDTGALIPGHGGLLDRLDSLLFNIPALYYYVTYLGSRP